MARSIFLNRQTPPRLLTLTLLAGLSSLAMNLMLPSLPQMATYFDAPYGLMQLTVSLYLALSAVLQILVGPISDRFGRRPVMLWGLVLFLIATVGTLLATNVMVFLAFRMAQAVISVGMVLSRAVVRDMVDGPRAASMIGYVTMGMSLVPMVGPVIGGALQEAFGWQSNFVMLLVLGLVVTALTWADMGETAVTARRSFADQVRLYPVLLGAPRFWSYCGAAGFASGCFYAFLGGAPFVGAMVFGLSPAAIGAAFALPSIGYAAGNYLAGRFSVRFGMNRMVFVGTLVTTLGMAALALITWAGLSGPWVFFGFMAALGLGNGICLPNANAGMLSIRPELAGTASGLGGALVIGGGAALSALAVALLPPGSGEMPLILLMLGSSLASTLAILPLIHAGQDLRV
ncbi:MAG: multidrug effflux MFS transporter [Cypionkella sp.]